MTLRQQRRDTVRVIPYRVTTDFGMSVSVDTLQYWLPERVTDVYDVLATTQEKNSPLTIREIIMAERARLLWRQRRAEQLVIARLRQRTNDVRSSQQPASKYTPREIECDKAGYTPKSVYSRNDLLLLLLRAARYA